MTNTATADLTSSPIPAAGQLYSQELSHTGLPTGVPDPPLKRRCWQFIPLVLTITNHHDDAEQMILKSKEYSPHYSDLISMVSVPLRELNYLITMVSVPLGKLKKFQGLQERRKNSRQFWYIGCLFHGNKNQRPKAQEKLSRGELEEKRVGWEKQVSHICVPHYGKKGEKSPQMSSKRSSILGQKWTWR